VFLHASCICMATAKTATIRPRLQKISRLTSNEDDTPRSELVKMRARIRATRKGKTAKPNANTSRNGNDAPPLRKVKSKNTNSAFATAKPSSKAEPDPRKGLC